MSRIRKIDVRALTRWILLLVTVLVGAIVCNESSKSMVQGFASLLVFCLIYSLFSLGLHFAGITEKEATASSIRPEIWLRNAFPILLVLGVIAALCNLYPLAAFLLFGAYACADEVNMRAVFRWQPSLEVGDGAA